MSSTGNGRTVSVHVAASRYARESPGSSVSTTISVGDRRFPVVVRSAGRRIRPVINRGDTWLPLALIPAMRENRPLVIADPVSPRLMESVPAIQSTLAEWYPDLSIVPVTAPRGRVRRRRGADATFQFFTGGVDSFFSLLRTDAPVGALVYVHGYDVPLPHAEHRQRVSESLSNAARELGTPLIELESNARELLDCFGDWGDHTHGAALASIGLLLGAEASRVILPATHTLAELEPWGSHPLLDPLWSTDRTMIVHHGAEASRFAKISVLAGHPVVSHHLRVCWNTTTQLNCSDCEKCLRTMTAFDILGQLPSLTTFRQGLDVRRLSDFPPTNDSELAFTTDNRDAARHSDRVDITSVLDPMIESYLADPPARALFTPWPSQ
jgi:hypothetical protein